MFTSMMQLYIFTRGYLLFIFVHEVYRLSERLEPSEEDVNFQLLLPGGALNHTIRP